MQAYCVRCKMEMEMEMEMRNPSRVTLKNRRKVTKGTCLACGIKMFRIGG